MTREAKKDKRGREIINEDALLWYNERHAKPEREEFLRGLDKKGDTEWESLLVDPDREYMPDSDLDAIRAQSARNRAFREEQIRRNRAFEESPAGKREAAKQGYQKSPSSVRKPKTKRLKKIKKYYSGKPKGYPRKPKGSLK